MAQIGIFTDTNSDLTKELRDKYSIEYFKMCNVIDGKQDVYPFIFVLE